MCRHCPLLKRIFFGGSDNLTDVSVLAVADKLPGLTHIVLERIDAITSSAVEVLAKNCSELEHIDLTYCPNVSDITLAKIAEHSTKLVELWVNGCDVVTAAGVMDIATKCSQLKVAAVNLESSCVINGVPYKQHFRQTFPGVFSGIN
jgi:hypothetical protein